MKFKMYHRSVVYFYNSVVVFLLLTIWITRASFQLSSFLIMLLIVPVGIYFTLALVNSFFNFSSMVNGSGVRLMHSLLSVYCLLLTGLFFLSMLVNISRPAELLFTLALFPLPGYLLYQHWLKTKSKLKKYARLVMLLTKSFNKKSSISTTSIATTVGEFKSKSEPAIMVKDEQLKYVEGEQQSEYVDSTLESTAVEYIEEENQGFKSIVDLDRRKFLKLIGGTSLGFAVLSLVMPHKASAAFFGSVPGPGTVALKDSSGNQIDPSERSPTDGYNISEIDDAALPSYYGFVDKDGRWYISKEDSAGSYRYTKGASDFATNWTDRTSLTYNYFDVIFS